MTTNKINYQRPEKTYQDRLSNQDINDKLKDYIIVEDIKTVPINVHLRYFIYDPQTKKRKFRVGGKLLRIDSLGRFITLSNDQISWSVQIPNTIFYKKLNLDEYKEELKKEILTEINSDTNNNDYKKNNLVISKMEKLIEENNILKKNNQKLIKQLNKIQIEINKKK